MVHGVLLLMALWPAVHIGLARGFGVNPWKLAGWGMYAAPQIPCDVEVYPVISGQATAQPLETVSAAVRPVLERFRRRRLALGRLAEPRALGRELLEVHPGVEGFDIVVIQPVLEPRSGMVRDVRSAYEYRR